MLRARILTYARARGFEVYRKRVRTNSLSQSHSRSRLISLSRSRSRLISLIVFSLWIYRSDPDKQTVGTCRGYCPRARGLLVFLISTHLPRISHDVGEDQGKKVKISPAQFFHLDPIYSTLRWFKMQHQMYNVSWHLKGTASISKVVFAILGP